MKKYWFISYIWRLSGNDPVFGSNLIDMHPFKWIDILNNGTFKGNTKYTLLSYQEISEEEYKMYNGKINQ
jgi:hypothetical protein